MKIGNTLGRLAAVLAVAIGLAAPAAAGTLDDIKARGTLRMGVLGELPPWGFIDATGQSQGYDVEVVGSPSGVTHLTFMRKAS